MLTMGLHDILCLTAACPGMKKSCLHILAVCITILYTQTERSSINATKSVFASGSHTYWGIEGLIGERGVNGNVPLDPQIGRYSFTFLVFNFYVRVHKTH